MKLRIIVPAHTTAFNDRILAAVQSVKAPDVEVDIRDIAGGSQDIESRINLATNAPFVIKAVQEAEADGIDGVFVTDFDMCGVEAARQAVSIPVIGGCRASTYTAMMLSQKFALITILEDVVDMQRQHFRAFGVADNLACIKPINVPVKQLTETELVIMKVYNEALDAIKNYGAASVILGCTGFIGVAEPVQELLAKDGYHIPVMDPNKAALSYLTLLVRNNVSQSQITYPLVSCNNP